MKRSIVCWIPSSRTRVTAGLITLLFSAACGGGGTDSGVTAPISGVPVPAIALECSPSSVIAPLGGSITITCTFRRQGASDGNDSFTLQGADYTPGVSLALLGGASGSLTSSSMTVFVAVNIDSTTASGPRNGRIVATFGTRTVSAALSITIIRTQARLRMVYLIPSDRSFDPAVAEAMERAARHLQIWYAQQLGGVTFAIHNPVVDVYRSAKPSSYFAVNAFNGVGEEVFAAFNGKYYDPANIWAVYFDVQNTTSGTGGGAALATLPRADVLGITGHDPQGVPPARWLGGLGHEVGHAFGLPHPPGCDAGQPLPDCSSIMYGGLYNYPNTFIAADQIATLRTSQYFQSLSPTLMNFDANRVTGIYQLPQ